MTPTGTALHLWVQESQKQTQWDTDEGTEGSEKNEGHMIVCVTDRRETSAPLWEITEDLKKTLVEVLWGSVRLSDRDYGRLQHRGG